MSVGLSSCCSSATPHARGSTFKDANDDVTTSGYPACAGIDLLPRIITTSVVGLPRMRGDRPFEYVLMFNICQATPHARGSTGYGLADSRGRSGYPACAGIDRILDTLGIQFRWLPRMRGDRPVLFIGIWRIFWATPHARGSTSCAWIVKLCKNGYPACAGIDPFLSVGIPKIERLPRMRGDRPLPTLCENVHRWATPHARGSTRPGGYPLGLGSGYPACAGIDPSARSQPSHTLRLPRMRGDRPYLIAEQRTMSVATPHARGSTRG